ncbi:hypothetical protein Cni_G14748 [Canna indica]|uniref:Uncharacterized protein n=1 Tax=Canna indica TaxID=4628 RepID=A0AAQ3QE34_9LILI|nr:hypothetical protein Cni_G14748 [Canna indica]
MIRSLKKLKLWSVLKKRRRKSTAIHESQQHSGHSYSRAAGPLPSAPPLPPWPNFQHSVNATDAGGAAAYLPSLDSYQQYLVPSPVYGGVAVVQLGMEREGAYCGCYAGFAALAALIRYCFCCLHQWPC